MEIEDTSDASYDKGIWYTKGDHETAVQAFANRMKDMYREGIKEEFSPIRGLAREPMVTLEEAVADLVDIIPNIDNCLDQCVRYVKLLKQLPEGLDTEEFQSLLLYTWPWEDLEGEISLYHLINTKLRKADREELQPYLRLLKVFLTALFKLTPYKGVVWTGVQNDLTAAYSEGQRFTWFGFNSFAENMTTVTKPRFVGRHATKTLLTLKINRGFKLTILPNLSEIIVPPGLQVRVKNVYNAGDGVKIVELEELVPEVPPFDFPEVVHEVGSEEYYLERLNEAIEKDKIEIFLYILKKLPSDKESYLYVTVFQIILDCLENDSYRKDIEREDSVFLLLVEVLEMHTDDVSVQKLGFRLLHNLDAFRRMESILSNRMMRAVSKCLGKHPELEDFQIEGHAFLQTYLISDHNKYLAGLEGLCKTALLTLDLLKEVESVVEKVCDTLSLLAMNSKNQKQIGKDLHIILSCLKKHEDNPSLQENLTFLIARLLINKGNHIHFSEDDRMNMVVQLARKHLSNERVRCNCCQILARCAECNINHEIIVSQGGLSIILETLSSESVGNNVKAKCCAALANLASNRSSISAICQENGAELIIRAMEEHKHSESLQASACHAVSNLWTCGVFSRLEDRAKETVHQALVLHPEHRGVQANGCSAMANIWEGKEEFTETDLSVIEPILKAVRVQYDHKATQQYGFLALSKISKSPKAQSLLQTDHDVMTVTVASLKSHWNFPRIQENIFNFLATLCKKTYFQKELVRHGAPDWIAKIMIKMPHNISIQDDGSGILSQLAENKDHRRRLGQSIILQAMSNAKVKYPNDNKIQKNATIFLKTQQKKRSDSSSRIKSSWS